MYLSDEEELRSFFAKVVDTQANCRPRPCP